MPASIMGENMQTVDVVASDEVKKKRRRRRSPWGSEASIGVDMSTEQTAMRAGNRRLKAKLHQRLNGTVMKAVGGNESEDLADGLLFLVSEKENGGLEQVSEGSSPSSVACLQEKSSRVMNGGVSTPVSGEFFTPAGSVENSDGGVISSFQSAQKQKRKRLKADEIRYETPSNEKHSEDAGPPNRVHISEHREEKCYNELLGDAESLDAAFLLYSLNHENEELANNGAGLQQSHRDHSQKEAGYVANRPRRRREGLTRKRRHFYEVEMNDLNPFSLVKQRIRVLWPLDDTWYFGRVKEYDPVLRLHHVRYEDKDNEWVDLRKERFKLLLYPSEVARKSNHKIVRLGLKKNSEDESEDEEKGLGRPTYSKLIVSSLHSSMQRTRSSAAKVAKKEKNMQKGRRSNLPESSQCTSVLPLSKRSDKAIQSHRIPKDVITHLHDGFEQTESYPSNRMLKHVYFRKRFRGKKYATTENTGLGITSGNDLLPDRACCFNFKGAAELSSADSTESWVPREYQLLVPLRFYNAIISEGHAFWYCYPHFILQHGILMNKWPLVHLDILILDNAFGLRYVSEKICLNWITPLLCSLVRKFCCCMKQPNFQDFQDLCTSFVVNMSDLHGRCQVGLAFFSSLPLRSLRWLNLTKKLHSASVMLELPKGRCTYSNISSFTKRAAHNSLPLLDMLSPEGLLNDCRKDPEELLKAKPISSVLYPIICYIDELRQNDFQHEFVTLSLLRRHLKLLAEENLAPNLSLRPSTVMNGSGSTNGKLREQISGCKHEAIYISLPEPINDSSMQSEGSLELADEQISRKNGSSNQPVTDLVQAMNEHAFRIATPTARRCARQRRNFTSTKHSFEDGSRLLSEDFVGGANSCSKKPRTENSYIASTRRDDVSKNLSGQNEILFSEDANVSSPKKLSIESSISKMSCEFSCEANVLVTDGIIGWREYCAQILLDTDEQCECKIVVKLSGSRKFVYIVNQLLQPGAPNRYTHAMVWKGGKDWSLEFTNRRQWSLFKHLYEECYNRNIRASFVKNIPIPGVRLVELVYYDSVKVPFRRGPNYYQHIGSEVDRALDQSRVLYDLDSEDEEWICTFRSSNGKEVCTNELSDDLFERIIDRFEKLAYNHHCEEFSRRQVEEFLSDLGPVDIISSIHQYWCTKRHKKGMPLIRQLQPPLWKYYEKQLSEWELTVSKIRRSSSGGGLLPERPPKFSFCSRPRGLAPNKGLKQRSHKKLAFSGCTGRRSYELSAGERRRHQSPEDEDWLLPSLESYPATNTKMHCLRSSNSALRHGSAGLHHRNSKKPKTDNWTSDVNGSANCKHPMLTPRPVYHHRAAVEELRLRDAVTAAKHTTNVAKLKREKARLLMIKADFALQRASLALMIADAIRTSRSDAVED